MIERACIKCGRITDQARCDEHRLKAWDDKGQRATRTTNGWAQQRRAKAMLAINDTCHVCGQHGANQIDHVTPLSQGGTDTRDNLAPIHARPCHATKTQREAQAGRANEPRFNRGG